MKKYKSLLVSSLVLSFVLLSPSAILAQGNNENGKDEQRNSQRMEKDFGRGNFMGKFQNWFGHRINKDNAKTAPVISNFTATATRPHKATISWDTDVKSNSKVWYSKTSPVDTSGTANIIRNGKNTKHKFNLNKLDANTKYYVIVKSTDSIGTTTSSEISFTTTEANNTNPVITSLTGPTTIVVNTTMTVTVNANDPQNGPLNYTATWGDGSAQVDNGQNKTFSHVYNTSGTYTATFTVKDSENKTDSSTMSIVVTPVSVDTTNPVMSNLQILTSSTAATISWKTDELSTGAIYYSTITPLDVNGVSTLNKVDTSLATNHSLNISLLAPGTIYHFILKSADASNNTAVSSEYSFITN